MSGGRSVEVGRFPQGKFVDALRWLPPISATDRLLVVASSASSSSSSIEIQSLSNTAASLHVLSSCSSPARISSLKVAPSLHKTIIAASSTSGRLLFLAADLLQASIDTIAISHVGSGINGMDLEPSTCQCVSVREDGTVNLLALVEAQVHQKRLFDNPGLLSFTATRWASPTEFVTAGLGLGSPLHWWDLRTPRLIINSNSNWRVGSRTAGVIHSIDVHPSRKHLCVVGGSSGSVFAWDLRWQQEPISLIDTGSSSRKISGLLSESEVWEVKYDHYAQSASLGAASNKIPPVMMCSEDGILAVFESGEAPLEVLAEPCAINTFDIDPENSSDVICGLEWETVLFLKRS